MLNQLRDIGLGENEAKVYVALLELGPSTVLQIAGKAGINRPTTYVQLEALRKRDLIETITKGKKTLISPKEPAQLAVMLEREAAELEVQKSELGKVLPQLQTMWTLAGKKPIVRYFEGIEGLRQIQAEFLKCKSKELWGINSVDAVTDIFPAHFQDFSKRRIRAGIKTRSIYTSSRGAILPAHDEEALRESRFVDPKQMPFTSDITIYDDSIALASLSGVVSGTIITHKELADSFRALYSFLWSVIANKNPVH